jgi:hypothetical protein
MRAAISSPKKVSIETIIVPALKGLAALIMSQVDDHKRQLARNSIARQRKRMPAPHDIQPQPCVDSAVEIGVVLRPTTTEASSSFDQRQLLTLHSLWSDNLSRHRLESQASVINPNSQAPVFGHSEAVLLEHPYQRQQIIDVRHTLRRDSMSSDLQVDSLSALITNANPIDKWLSLSTDGGSRDKQPLSDSKPHRAPSTASPIGSPTNRSAAEVDSPRFHSEPKLAKPKRPLSAYNVFFREERTKIIAEQEGTHPTSPPDSSPTRKQRNQPNGIGFEDLAKEISKRWKHVGKERLEECTQRANADMVRYQTELALYSEQREARLSAKQRAQIATVSEETWAGYLAAAESHKPPRKRKSKKRSQSFDPNPCEF